MDILIRNVIFRTSKMIIIVSSLIFFCAFLILFFLYQNIPSEREIRSCMTTKMFKVYLCPGTEQYIPLSQISPYLIRSVILSEDAAFYSHSGFDFVELERSIRKNIKEKKMARGASTITQQLAKNLFLTSEKTILRKLIEAIITFKIERTLSKKEILEKYLNVIQYGKDVFGIKRASEFYFKKEAKNLSVIESAFLVFLLPNPDKYAISFFKKKLTPYAEKRIQNIVDLLFSLERITSDEHKQAREQLLVFLTPPNVLLEQQNFKLTQEEQDLQQNIENQDDQWDLLQKDEPLVEPQIELQAEPLVEPQIELQAEPQAE